jgi:hypothetical protein
MPILLPLAAQTASPPPDDPNDQEVVVRGERPAVVVRDGRPRCRPLSADPYDRVVAPSHHPQSVVAPNRRTGALEIRPDNNPVSGTVAWHRAGTGIGAFVFRAPVNGSTLCIGGDRPGDQFGQLRQILDARPYRGKIVRFTAWIATSRAQDVRLWFAAGDAFHVLIGDDTRSHPLRGTMRWTPISFTIGPVPRLATKLSYGFLLQGDGDVWLTRPQVQILTASELGNRPAAAGVRE